MKINEIYTDGLCSYPDLLKISDIQKILNISKSTVIRMLNRKELTRLKFSYGTRIAKEEVISLIKYSAGKDVSA